MAKVTPKVVKKENVESSKGMSVDVFDSKGAVVGSIELPAELFAGKINNTLLAQAVRIYLANQRKGTAVTKTRAEVTISTRKIYRQKGTGRARHGAKSAPIFVGGGVAHGPKLRDYSLDFPKKMKKAALISALSSKAQDKKIMVVQGLESVEPKTKSVAALLKKLDTKGSHMLVLAGKTENVKRAARNIPSVSIKGVNHLSVYEIMVAKQLIFMKEAITELAKSGVKE